MKEVMFKFQLSKSEGFIMDEYFNHSPIHIVQDHVVFLYLHHSVPRGIKAFLFVAMEMFYPLHFLLSLVFFVLVHLCETEF